MTTIQMRNASWHSEIDVKRSDPPFVIVLNCMDEDTLVMGILRIQYINYWCHLHDVGPCSNNVQHFHSSSSPVTIPR